MVAGACKIVLTRIIIVRFPDLPPSVSPEPPLFLFPLSYSLVPFPNLLLLQPFSLFFFLIPLTYLSLSFSLFLLFSLTYFYFFSFLLHLSPPTLSLSPPFTYFSLSISYTSQLPTFLLLFSFLSYLYSPCLVCFPLLPSFLPLCLWPTKGLHSARSPLP